jgi:hypothetical protein
MVSYFLRAFNYGTLFPRCVKCTKIHRQGSKLPCCLVSSTIRNSGEPARCIIKFYANGFERYGKMASLLMFPQKCRMNRFFNLKYSPPKNA